MELELQELKLTYKHQLDELRIRYELKTLNMEKRELASDQNAYMKVCQQVESMCKEIRKACQGNQAAVEVIEREMKRFGNSLQSRQ